MSEFQLGQRVRVTGQMMRRNRRGREKVWEERPTDVAFGYITGVRSYTDGRTEGGYDEPFYWEPRADTRFTGYLVAYNLHRKPIVCRADQIEADDE